MSCDKCDHKNDGCNEKCQCCAKCYSKYGLEECDRICEHAMHEDDGGFLIDGNHPDDMFGVHIIKED